MKTKTRIKFSDLPKDYAALCQMLPPRIIHDDADYENVCEVVEAMAGFEHKFTADQDDYFAILAAAIEGYEGFAEKRRAKARRS